MCSQYPLGLPANEPDAIPVIAPLPKPLTRIEQFRDWLACQLIELALWVGLKRGGD